MSSKKRLENLLEPVPDALVGMDQAGVTRFVNHQTESLFGYDRDNLVGQPIQTLAPEYLWEGYSKHQEYFADPRSRSMGLDLPAKRKATRRNCAPGQHQFVPPRHRRRPVGDHGVLYRVTRGIIRWSADDSCHAWTDWWVTAILKENPATADAPIVALSALAMKANEERSQTAGCDAYIVKPVRYKQLYVVMERLLKEPHPPAGRATSPDLPPT